jgi:hypothetical protein
MVCAKHSGLHMYATMRRVHRNTVIWRSLPNARGREHVLETKECSREARAAAWVFCRAN